MNSTSIKARNTTSEETASNKSSLSEKEQPNSAYKSPNSKLEPLIQEVTGESRNRKCCGYYPLAGFAVYLRSVAAGENRSASGRSNRRSPPVYRSLQTWLSRSSTPGRPEKPSSSQPPPRGSDAPEYKRKCCFSRARPAPSSRQHSSSRILQRAYPYSLGNGQRVCPIAREPRDRYAVHRPSLILSSRHLGASPPRLDSRLGPVETHAPLPPLCQPVGTPTVARPATMCASSCGAF